jgi:succinoglycan biosynthesis protein ExoA
MKEHSFISVIIPCRNEKNYIESCLASVLGQEPPEAGFEVLVADGMSDDGTREILLRMAREHPQLRVIDNPPGIVPTGLNAAIKAARGDIIIRMDAHTEYAPDYIRQSVAALAGTGAANVGGPARTKSRSYLQKAICVAYHLRRLC